jgi:putative phage-type endonuclease
MPSKIFNNINIECNLTEEYLQNIKNVIKNEYNKKIKKNSIFKHICGKYNIFEQVQEISRMKQYKQRSPEWFAQRENMISASDMAAVFNIGYNKQKQLLEKKVLNNNTFKGNKYTRWGQKYEDVASIVYEKRNNKIVLEFGLIQHPEYSYIGASPDGITTDGIMLEIKCPSTREITGIPPDNYEIQMQIQLEVCELDVCDFCEIKVDEFYSEEEYLEYDGELEKGIIVGCKNYYSDEYIYFYPKSYMLGNDELLFEWRDKIINENKSKYNIIEPCYWYLLQYSCVPVYRNRAWFNEQLGQITELWNKVIYYREHLEEYHQTYKKRKKNVKVIQLEPITCDFEDELDDTINETKKCKVDKKVNEYIFESIICDFEDEIEDEIEDDNEIKKNYEVNDEVKEIALEALQEDKNVLIDKNINVLSEDIQKILDIKTPEEEENIILI